MEVSLSKDACRENKQHDRVPQDQVTLAWATLLNTIGICPLLRSRGIALSLLSEEA